MSISTRRDFKAELAQTLLNDIQSQRGRYYYFLGGIEPWSGIGNEGATDLAEILNTLSDRESASIRSEMIFAKLISPNDASLGIRRIEWESGTQYDYWDDTINMEGKNFYVINSNHHVYKCLDNGVQFGAGSTNVSTVEPTNTPLYPFKTTDGYIWKYMYSVSPYARTRFSSVEYIPVKRAISDSFYNNGAVDNVAVLTSGVNYPDAQLTTINVSGTTTGSGAAGTLVVDGNGTITDVTISNGGTGYTKGVRITVSGSLGAGAVLEAVIAAGVITDITVVEGGIGYSISDTVNFTVGGAELIPVISRTTGSIIDVKIIDPGVGYTSAPTLTLVVPPLSGESGKYGNPTALLEAVEFNGSIVQVAILDPGIDYPFDNATSISVLGDGTGAEFSPVIIDGKLVDVIVENPGEGYTNIILTVQSAVGSGATVAGIITQSDYESIQSAIEQLAEPGKIFKIVVDAEGLNYSAGTTVTITGNGTGCTATPVIVGGRIKFIEVTNYGSGYTWADVTITDPFRPIETIPVEQRASLHVVLPPVGGHGKDAPIELFCSTLVINTPLRGELSSLNVAQDYRLFGILKDPKTILTKEKFTRQSSLLTIRVKCTNTSSVTKDQIWLFGADRFRVIDKTSGTISFAPLTSKNVSPVGSLSLEGASETQISTSETEYVFDMDKYSGKLLYVSTENPFEFSAEQSLTFKTFITF